MKSVDMFGRTPLQVAQSRLKILSTSHDRSFSQLKTEVNQVGFCCDVFYTVTEFIFCVFYSVVVYVFHNIAYHLYATCIAVG